MSETHLKIINKKINVSNFYFNNLKVEESENEETLINSLRPELNKICFNSIRASIVHLLFNSKELNYSMSVERIAHKLGKRHSVVLYHLEKLAKWKIVKVAKTYNHGDKERRSLWGLNSKFPNLVSEVYSYMLKTFYTVKELEQMCNINVNVRKAA